MSKEEKKCKLVIVDSDGLTYHSCRETLEESIEVLNAKIQNIYDKTEATHSIFLISKGKYFRHTLSSDYKANRGKYGNPLKWLKTLKSYLEENYNAYFMYNVEADDVAALLMREVICSDTIRIEAKKTFESVNCILQEEGNSPVEFNKIDVVLAAVDKDLLKSIVGTHFNYSYKVEDKTKPEEVIKGWWVTTTEEEALYNFWVSMIVGDVTDGIKGCVGKGVKYAEKLFAGFTTEQSYMDLTLATYVTTFGTSLGIYEFQKNYRLLHLLESDSDFIREVNDFITFPIVNSITKEIKTDYI